MTLAHIETQLQRLWSSGDGGWDKSARRPDIRTSVLNLIVYARDEACREHASGAIDRLSGTHPSRALILVPGRTQAHTSIDAEVSITSRGAYEEYGQVCSEQIVLWVHGPAVDHLDSLAQPLTVPDLPTFLWWPGEAPFGSRGFPRLKELADRIIIDSGEFPDIREDVVRLAAAVRESRARSAFSDFSWARLAVWREMLAGLFDEPLLRPCLDRLSSVQVDCPHALGDGWDEAQALLLGAWLATCLGFDANARDLSADRCSVEFRRGGRRLSLQVRRGAANAGLRLQAEAGTDEPMVEVRLVPNLPARTAQVEVRRGAAQNRHQVALHITDESQLLYRELEMFSADEPYERAVLMASTMLEPRYRAAAQRGSMLA